MATNPQIPAALRSLAADAGIVLEYVDATGVEETRIAEVLLAVLNALGVPIGRTSDAARLLRSRRSARVERIVEPVTVLDDACVGEVMVSFARRTPIWNARSSPKTVSASTGALHRDELGSLTRERLDGRDIYRGAVPLPGLLQCGYHRFTVLVRGRVGTATLVVAPAAGARGRFSEDWRAFGIFAPLFSLHSARSWGSGDLSDLDELRPLCRQGAGERGRDAPLARRLRAGAVRGEPLSACEPPILARTLDRRGARAGVRLVARTRG